MPSDKAEARKLKIKATRYCIMDELLFNKSPTCMLLRCIEQFEAKTILQSFHDGECGNHTGGRSLANKALRMGYFWPTMRKDAVDYARKCKACQICVSVTHQPSDLLHPTLAPWPFMRWEMNFVGKISSTTGQKVFFLSYD